MALNTWSEVTVEARRLRRFGRRMLARDLARAYNQWLDVLDMRGAMLTDDELLELLSENRTISGTLEDHLDKGQKMTSVTTAQRLADFLGSEMVKDKGLACKLIVARLPAGRPVTERAIPTAIFSAEPAVQRHYLRKWLKETGNEAYSVVEVLEKEGDTGVGQADIFLSHVQSETIETTLVTLNAADDALTKKYLARLDKMPSLTVMPDSIDSIDRRFDLIADSLISDSIDCRSD